MLLERPSVCFRVDVEETNQIPVGKKGLLLCKSFGIIIFRGFDFVVLLD
jgi:hypothetical protein